MIDTAVFERQLFASGQRHGATVSGKSSKPRARDTMISLFHLLQSLGIDVPCTLHNAGNDAMMCLLALQVMLEPKGTEMPGCKLLGIPATCQQFGGRRPGPEASANSQMRRSIAPASLASRPRPASEHIERPLPTQVPRVPGPASSVRRKSMPPTVLSRHSGFMKP